MRSVIGKGLVVGNLVVDIFDKEGCAEFDKVGTL